MECQPTSATASGRMTGMMTLRVVHLVVLRSKMVTKERKYLSVNQLSETDTGESTKGKYTKL